MDSSTSENLAILNGPEGEDTAAAAEWEGRTLGQALDHCCARWVEKELLIFPERRFSAHTLAAEVERFACGLLHLGVGRGEHVAVWLPNLPEYVVAEFALARLGAAMVPVNLRYKTSELEYVLRQSDATTLLLHPQLFDIDFLGMLRKVCPEIDRGPADGLRCRALPGLRRVITLGEPAPGLLCYQDVLRRGDQPELAAVLRARESEVTPESMVLLQYTSGTTAFPKAVMLAHGQVLRNAFQMAVRAGIESDDRVLSVMPMFHVGGSVCALLGSVTVGYSLYLGPKFDAAETLRVIEEEHITTYIGLEAMFLAIRHHEDFSRRSRDSLVKGWAAGTSSLLRMVAEEIGIRNVCSLYGLSEASPNVCIADWRDPFEKRIGTMGRPQPGLKVKIIDPTTGETLRHSERGEICVRGWSVMKGYYNKPEETRAAIDPEGWLHTGDQGLVDEDGYLVWCGRLKDMLRVGGENVSALEVENFLCSHPHVRAAAVVGVPDERLGEVGLAFIQLKSGAQATEEEIIAYCRERIAVFKVPGYVRFVEQFEMTGSGKIQKFRMREQALEEMGLGQE
jgi:fatty-acyl-CoA synthase